MISIIIATRNRANLLNDLFKNLNKIKGTFEVVIVDDCSNDNTKEIINPWKNKLNILYIKNKKRLGSTQSFNKGAEASKYQNIVFIADDDLIEKPESFIDDLMNNLKIADIISFKHIETINIKQSFLKAFVNFTAEFFLKHLGGAVFPVNFGKKRYVDFVYGAMALDKKIVKEIGFNPIFKEGGYREETDFQIRARKKAYKILFDPNIVIIHRSHPVGGQRDWNLDKALIKNHIIYLKYHHPLTKFYKIPLYFLLVTLIRRLNLKSSIQGLIEGIKIKI